MWRSEERTCFCLCKRKPIIKKALIGIQDFVGSRPELVTAEGFVIKGPQASDKTGILFNTAKKGRVTSIQAVKSASRVEAVTNMKQVFGMNDFGTALERNTIKTKLIAKTDSQIYEVIKHLSKYGLKKGDLLYLDKFHGDHIEVFWKNRKFKTVLNLDGSENIAKLLKGVGRKL